MNKLLLTLLCFFTFSNLFAAEGDTTTVFVHDGTAMTWWGGYTEAGEFPDGSKTYRKITMTYTMGCPSSGCSDWDYTSKIELLNPTGLMDSTVSALDTISTMPLVVDTTWNVFEVIDNFELGRVITPYGGYMANGTNGFNNGWSFDHVFDVTDFATVLQSTKDIRAFYAGWSSGFSVSLRFDFIEGTPPRDVIKIENLYRSGAGGWSYTNSADFEANRTVPRDVQLDAAANMTRVRMTISGHGFINSLNAAEFYDRQYYFDLDGVNVVNNSFFRYDCGKNPIYPQGGTWLYDRAGWCPGLRTLTFLHELPTTAGSMINLDLRIQPYSVTVPSGETPPNYIIDAQLVSYGSPNFTTDAEIVDIISPSLQDEYGRRNPICGGPVIKIRNSGSDPLTSVTFRYGVEGGNACQYTWTGNLNFMEEEEVTLPAVSWVGYDVADPVFFAQIEFANNASDDYSYNNYMESTFVKTGVLTPQFLVYLNTNNAANETGYSVEDVDGNVLFERLPGTLSNSTTYTDTFDLDPGCYVFRVVDTGGDGLSWWNNNDGTGAVNIRRVDFPVTLKNFGTDFGSEIFFPFTIGQFKDIAGDPAACPPVGINQVAEAQGQFELFPNPNNGNFEIQFALDKIQDVNYTIFNALGQQVKQGLLHQVQNQNVPIQLSNSGAGIYMIVFETEEGSFSKKMVISQ